VTREYEISEKFPAVNQYTDQTVYDISKSSLDFMFRLEYRGEKYEDEEITGRGILVATMTFYWYLGEDWYEEVIPAQPCY